MSRFDKWKLIFFVVGLILVVPLFVMVVQYIHSNPSLLLPPYLGQGGIFNRTRVFSHPRESPQLHDLPGYISMTTLQPLRLHCDLCSIVSSSGQMLGQRAGSLVDRSACVWRMNNAPTAGFEMDVGTRTTIRVVSHTSVPLLTQRQQHYFGEANGTIYVIWGPYRNMRQDGKGSTYNALRQIARSYPHAKIYLTTEERMNYCDKVFQQETGKDRMQSGTYLSTGWFTLLLAMDVCQKIHIFGMINDTYCRAEGRKKVPYHYYEAGSQDECEKYAIHENALRGGHRFITEKAVFAKWAKTHNITFSHPASIYPESGS